VKQRRGTDLSKKLRCPRRGARRGFRILTSIIRIRYTIHNKGCGVQVKTQFENLPDLEAAFEAVRGQLFGPLDPARVKLKHKEIIETAKEKREREMDPRGSLARDDQAERDRKDRENQTRTLTWLLENDRAYRQAHERALQSFAKAGNAIDRAIAAGEKVHEKLRQQIDDYLASTARLKDGRYVMIDEDGTYMDQDGKPISAQDAAEVDGQPIRAFKPYDEMHERKAQIESGLAELRGWSVEVGDMKNRALDQENPTREEALAEDQAHADDLAERAAEKQRDFEQSSPHYEVKRHVEVVEQTASTASMAMPTLP
jgi:hypothetical protein